MHNSKIVLFVCGSFNPPTNMHFRMFEIARDHLHRYGNEVIGGIVSPVHDGYGKTDLLSATHRIAMLRLALESSDWLKLSDWEAKQETWTRTRLTLEYHQNQINAYMNSNLNNDTNEKDLTWLPDVIKNGYTGPVNVKLLCGADLLESFRTPGVWLDEDIEAILGQHGLVVVTRQSINPSEFIYNSDLLTKYAPNIITATEWFKNEISSTKIRRAIRRSESVKYLMSDKVIDYIHKHGLYGATSNKYIPSSKSRYAPYLTPSPSDITMETPSPISNNCLSLCNNNIFSTNYERLTINTVDGVAKGNVINLTKHPGQAVKIITEDTGEHKIIKDAKEVGSSKKTIKASKSCTDFYEEKNGTLKSSKSNANLKDCKNCDENLVKFIFTKHGIQVISDVETIV